MPATLLCREPNTRLITPNTCSTLARTLATLTGIGERRHLLNREIDLGTHTQDMLCVIDYEDLTDIVLVGHSYGGIVLLKAGLSPILTESPTGARSLRGARLMIRLRPDDQILLRERAAGRGMPPATYVSVLTRAHLRSLAPLPQEELLALKRTLAELGSIGRNLNQIARAANRGQLVTSPGRDDLTAMLRVCGTLSDSLKRVLLANLRSWEQGSP